MFLIHTDRALIWIKNHSDPSWPLSWTLHLYHVLLMCVCGLHGQRCMLGCDAVWSLQFCRRAPSGEAKCSGGHSSSSYMNWNVLQDRRGSPMTNTLGTIWCPSSWQLKCNQGFPPEEHVTYFNVPLHRSPSTSVSIFTSAEEQFKEEPGLEVSKMITACRG